MERRFGNPVTVVAGGPSFPDAVAVTPSDSATLSPEAAALYVGGLGDLEVVTAGGQTLTFPAVAAGTLIPLRVKQVLAASTTATSIVALY